MALAPPASTFADAAARLVAEATRAQWRGPDPYDALWWPRWPSVLVAGRRRRQAVIQLHARAPVDVRRLYRRDHPRLDKAVALFAMASLRLDRLRPGQGWAATAREA